MYFFSTLKKIFFPYLPEIYKCSNFYDWKEKPLIQRKDSQTNCKTAFWGLRKSEYDNTINFVRCDDMVII